MLARKSSQTKASEAAVPNDRGASSKMSLPGRRVFWIAQRLPRPPRLDPPPLRYKPTTHSHTPPPLRFPVLLRWCSQQQQQRAAARRGAASGARMSAAAGKVVCVTGASGYIASWLVKLLLEKGYTVKATVRDPGLVFDDGELDGAPVDWSPVSGVRRLWYAARTPLLSTSSSLYDHYAFFATLMHGAVLIVHHLGSWDDPKKTEHLRQLEGASERLNLFKANLLEEGAFDVVVDGCEGVFHTASPFFNAVTDPQAELIDPAVKGTLNVLRSCAKIASIKRVVVTSSVAAVAYNERPRTPDVIVDETWFSSPELCEANKSWYVLSKTLAEEAAWKFAKENGINMVTINPAMVIGPLLQPTLNTSAAAILNLINGAPTFPNTTFGWVNVRDVAIAHILAFEVPSASGRYCLVERVAHYSEIVDAIRKLYPDLQLPEKCADDEPFVPVYQMSKEKATSLGVNYTPLEVSLKETIESLVEKKFFKL
ncbi:hypothetical protein Taro_004726 [Colocasia esculenta]|uniref:NAD-dependent epimerase/dehydratase domain-containing protein n=1 Tax=Colocasia esculenta TaxID=4460 RepID=A0A843TSJ9_COLES|nr:hypothetical protein [Colocasia esculenta]